MPNSNREYWEKKLRRNVERDNEVNKYYSKLGWKVLRIWEHEVKHEFEDTIEKIVKWVNESKSE
jgi:DNA mismatch endonuclease (patch repair protein)